MEIKTGKPVILKFHIYSAVLRHTHTPLKQYYHHAPCKWNSDQMLFGNQEQHESHGLILFFNTTLTQTFLQKFLVSVMPRNIHTHAQVGFKVL